MQRYGFFLDCKEKKRFPALSAARHSTALDAWPQRLINTLLIKSGAESFASNQKKCIFAIWYRICQKKKCRC